MKKALFILLAAIVLFSCKSSISVVSDVDPTADFSSFKTLEYYGWTKESQQKLPAFYRKNIERAFGAEFKNRGMTLVEEGEGDIIVSLYIVTEQKMERVAHTTSTYDGTVSPANMGNNYAVIGSSGNVHVGTAYGYGYGGYGGYYGYGPSYGWGMGHPRMNSSTTYSDQAYDKGTLIISVYDAKKKELIWESVGSKKLADSIEDVEDAKDKIRDSVSEIMKKYPVRAKK